jgi:hypothetical protein
MAAHATHQAASPIAPSSDALTGRLTPGSAGQEPRRSGHRTASMAATMTGMQIA